MNHIIEFIDVQCCREGYASEEAKWTKRDDDGNRLCIFHYHNRSMHLLDYIFCPKIMHFGRE